MEIKVLDFTGKWCSSCIVLDKIIETEVIPKYKNKVKFVKVDIEENSDLIKQYDILLVPTLILFTDNKEIWKKSGSISKDEIIKELDKVVR